MGIQISNLLSNSAFDWKSVVTQLIDVQKAATITPVETEIAKNTEKSSALAQLGTLLTTLQDSAQAIRSNDIFSSRTVSSATSTTWKSTSSKGAPVGTYTFAVSQLATQAQYKGATNIGASLASSSDVSGVTLATMRTATTVSAGTFTVNGQQVTVATSASLKDIFDAISTATSGAVTASYDATTDKVTFASSGEIVLGASNDTSNFLSALKLANNGTGSITSSGTLGTVKTTAALASAGLTTAASGSGTFSINGVSIAYDTSSDTLGGLINRINNSAAGVTATYDSVNDRMTLTNNLTGDTGIGLTDSGDGILASLGLTAASGAALTRGKNAIFTLNGGETLTSASNTLESAVHGISGLSVTVNSATTQTLQVESDTSAMQDAIQSFVDAFNAVQDYIDTNTKITITGTNVATSTLTGNREVEGWGRELRSMAFSAISGLTGTVKQLNDLGIDFDGTSNKLLVKDSEKLATALSDHPDDVKSFFLNGSTGFVSKFYTYLTRIGSANRTQQSNLSKANVTLNTQLERLNSQLTAEQDRLTSSFIAMQDAQSLAQTQSKALENAFFNNSSSGN